MIYVNTAYVMQDLHEAAEQLQNAIKAVQADEPAEFEVAIVFTYRKLNRAWNSRHVSSDELLSGSDKDSEARCQFPTELSFLIADQS